MLSEEAVLELTETCKKGTADLSTETKIEKTMFRVPEVMARYGLPKSTLYWMIEQGRFPRPCKIAARVVAFKLESLLAWEAAQRPAELSAT